jgi:hypothetical protein
MSFPTLSWPALSPHSTPLDFLWGDIITNACDDGTIRKESYRVMMHALNANLVGEFWCAHYNFANITFASKIFNDGRWMPVFIIFIDETSVRVSRGKCFHRMVLKFGRNINFAKVCKPVKCMSKLGIFPRTPPPSSANKTGTSAQRSPP